MIEYQKFAGRIAALGTSPSQVVAYLMNLVTHATTPEFVPSVVTEDPSDDLFLALAVGSQASLIVSGDQHLLALLEYEKISIVTPGEAVAVVRKMLSQTPSRQGER